MAAGGRDSPVTMRIFNSLGGRGRREEDGGSNDQIYIKDGGGPHLPSRTRQEKSKDKYFGKAINRRA